MTLHLMSHALCPYVQRAAISLFEKDVAVERTTIDLARKPDWFLALSPLGKTPVLTVEGQPIFDSVAILEFLEESQTPPLHPADPVVRAQHRGWIAFASEMLNDIAGFYGTSDPTVFDQKIAAMTRKVRRLEDQLSAGPYFNGATFSLVDAAFAPVFRYFDTFDRIKPIGILDDAPKVGAWRATLANRASVKHAVADSYPEQLWAFLRNRQSYLSVMMTELENSQDVG